MFICWLSQKKKNKTKKFYTVLEFTKREYCVIFFFFFFCILFIKGTWASYTWVLCVVLEFTKLEYHIIFFNHTNPIQQCHGGKTNEELQFLKLEFWKKWYFAIYFRNSVFFLKISKKGGIWPFWPENTSFSFHIINKMT